VGVLIGYFCQSVAPDDCIFQWCFSISWRERVQAIGFSFLHAEQPPERISIQRVLLRCSFRSVGDVASVDLSPGVSLCLQVRPECTDLLEDAPSRLRREATEDYATNWRRPYSYPVSQCVGEPLIGKIRQLYVFCKVFFLCEFSLMKITLKSASNVSGDYIYASKRLWTGIRSLFWTERWRLAKIWPSPLFLLRVVLRCRNHSISSKSFVKSTHGQLCWWTEVRYVKCTWVNLTRRNPDFWRLWTRYIMHGTIVPSHVVGFWFQIFFPADQIDRLLLNNHNFQVIYLTVAVGLLSPIFSMMKWSLICRIRRTPTHLLIWSFVVYTWASQPVDTWGNQLVPEPFYSSIIGC